MVENRNDDTLFVWYIHSAQSECVSIQIQLLLPFALRIDALTPPNFNVLSSLPASCYGVSYPHTLYNAIYIMMIMETSIQRPHLWCTICLHFLGNKINSFCFRLAALHLSLLIISWIIIHPPNYSLRLILSVILIIHWSN